MKKWMAMVCVALMTLSGCSGGGNPDSASGNGSTAQDPQNIQQSQGNQGTPDASSTSADTLTGEIGGEITVTCFDSMLSKNLLDEAAAAFEAKYPGTKVNVESFSEMPEIKTMESDGMKMSMITMGDNTQSKNDYITKINTELMGGRGADVLAMDVLPWYRYAENGQLENLQPFMDADPEYNASDYQKSIIDTLRYHNGQYLMPLDYDFEYFCYDETLLPDDVKQALNNSGLSYGQIIELMAASFDAYNANAETPLKMFPQDAEQLFNSLFEEQYSRFVDVPSRKANFNDGAFVSLLNAVQEYVDKGYIQGQLQRMSVSGDGGEDMMTIMRKSRDEQYFIKKQTSLSLMQFFNTNPDGPRLFMSTSGGGAVTENDKIAGQSVNADGQYPFSYSQAYAMNANSANKRTAWEFIKFLLGEETQTSMMLMGQPVNNQARADKAKNNITGAMFDPSLNTGTLDAEQQELYDTYMAAIDAYTARLNTYNMVDDTVKSLIEAEISLYFKGQQSAEDTASTLQNKVSLYLGE